MVSTTLTTIVSTSTGSNNHHYQTLTHSHLQQQQQQHHHQLQQPQTNRNFYLSSSNEAKTAISASVTNSSSSTATGSTPVSISVTPVGTATNSIPISIKTSYKNEPTSTGTTTTTTTTGAAAAAAQAPAAATTTTTTTGISVSPPLSDQISKLFPKCRPKNDVNLNPVQNNKPTTTSSPPSSSLSSESLSSVTPRISTNPFLNISNQEQYPPYYYRTSIKESHSCYPDMPRKRSYHGTSQNPFVKDNYWETRHNTTPASTVLNSPELTENETRNHFMQKQHIKVGRSPVSHPDSHLPITGSGGGGGGGSGSSIDPPPPGGSKGIAVVADGEVVVFDDISENWQSNLRVASEQNSVTITDPNKLDCPDDITCNDKKILDRNFEIASDTKQGIMEYEGSPRRIGQNSISDDPVILIQQNNPKIHNASPSQYTARPGFPQRIISTARESPPPIPDTKQSSTEDTSNDVSEIGTSSDITTSEPPKTSTFDYLYEFSETRKVLEEFFKCPSNDYKTTENGSDVDSIDIHYEFRNSMENDSNNYIGQRLAGSPMQNFQKDDDSPCQNGFASHLELASNDKDNHDIDFFLDSASKSSGDAIDNQDGINQNRVQSKSFRYSPETTDYDSNCGDLDSLSGEYNGVPSYTNHAKYFAASMPVLEDGLSSGHASDTENNNPPITGISMVMDIKRTPELVESRNELSPNRSYYKSDSPIKSVKDESGRESAHLHIENDLPTQSPNSNNKVFKNIDPELDSLYSISVFHRSDMVQLTPPPPAPAPHRKPSPTSIDLNSDITSAALKDVRSILQRSKIITPSILHEKSRHQIPPETPTPPERLASPILGSPVWIPRHMENSNGSGESEQPSKNLSADEEEVDTDLETDRLLGHQRLDDQGFYDENKSYERKSRSLLATGLSKFSPKIQSTKCTGSSLLRQGLNSLLPTTPEIVPPPPPPPVPPKNPANKLLDIGESISSPDHSEKSPDKTAEVQTCNLESPSGSNKSKKDSEKKAKKSKNKEAMALHIRYIFSYCRYTTVLIEGVLFRARYLGSTQLVCEGQPTKSTRMMQAEEAVSRIKAPDGEAQPSTEVDLFISTEKIMVLNTDLKEIMMDHALRTISYIADIGDLVVLMARRRFVPQDIDDAPKPNRTPKMICHVFESDEAQFIAQSIGQAFQVAYMEFLKANGIEDHSFVKEMDYQEVLNSQEIFGDELEIFAKKELQKEVVVPKAKGEILGVVIVESGWGSMLPTVVIANLMSSGAAARCGQLNIGDQLIAINGMSLVGLPLSTCQTYIKNTKNQTVVKFTVVPCAPVVEVKIKRPNTKYQLGFSVQNGVICSLLRGGIAERGGVRVGHRIIEINNQSVVAVPHEKIVNLLATSVGEILMKTMPTSMFRLLTGQENPIYI